jgi:hypothetical protein
VAGALAGVYLMLEDLQGAEACLGTVLTPQTLMDTIGRRCCWVRRGELALSREDPALALEITDRLIASAPGISPGRVIPYLWKLKAEALAAQGLVDEAHPLLSSALVHGGKTGERYLLWRLHADLGRIHHAMGQAEGVERELSAARVLIEESAATISDQTLKEGFRQGAHRVLQSAVM